MKSRINASREEAWNRLELLFILASLALLTAVALPSLANTKNQSQRLTCFSNLKQIGHAYQLWGNDRGNKTPCRTDISDGGTYGSLNSQRNLAWFQFSWISNQLDSPKMLVCPSDIGVGAPRVIATNWT